MLENRLLKNFSEYNPYLYGNVEFYIVYSNYELIVKTTNGYIYSYDDYDKNCRNIFNPELENKIDQTFEFGYRLSKLIKRCGYTQKEIANKTGLSECQVSNYTSCKFIPTLKNILKVTNVLGCRVDELVYNVTNEKEFENVWKHI